MRREGAISELGEGVENKGPLDAGLFEQIADRLPKVDGDHSRVSHHTERFPFGVEAAHSAFPVLAAAVDAESSTFFLNGSADDQSGAVLTANFKHRNLLVLPTIILRSTRRIHARHIDTRSDLCHIEGRTVGRAFQV